MSVDEMIELETAIGAWEWVLKRSTDEQQLEQARLKLSALEKDKNN